MILNKSKNSLASSKTNILSIEEDSISPPIQSFLLSLIKTSLGLPSLSLHIYEREILLISNSL